MSKVEGEEIVARKRQFDRELAEWEENGDPLCAWSGYLGWLEEKGLKRHDSYKKAIQQCLKYFGSLSEWFGEVRLARIYISAAELCKEPVTIFQHMQTKGIGIKFSTFYRAYSAALVEKGEGKEAIRVLEMGIRQEARPLNLLQKALTELKSEGNSLRGGKSAVVVDEKSERNEVFYRQPGVECHYMKQLVYPPNGGEQSLEHIRASLPQYAPTLPREESSGECDMDITQAQPGHITMLVPLAHNQFTTGRVGISGGDSFEIFQDETTDPSGTSCPRQRQPLGLLPNKPSPEEELELLIAEKNQSVEPRPPQSGRKRLVSEEELEQQLEQLVLERGQEVSEAGPPVLSRDEFTVEDDFHKELFGEGTAESAHRQPDEIRESKGQSSTHFQSALVTQRVNERDKENVADKENIVRKEFDFTPAGGVSVPSASSGVKELVTRLNFSEAELSLHQKSGLSHSLLHKSGVTDGRRETSLAMFNTTLDCEKRAKLTEEQLIFENEFANTEFHDGPLPTEHSYQPPSLINDTDQSFGVFHDSWNVSTKTNNSVSMGRSAFSRYDSSQGPKTRVPLQSLPNEQVRRPLQVLTKPQEPSMEEYSINSYSQSAHFPQTAGDSHYSCPPSQTADSFSVFEDSSRDQSSFVPYHDSWAERSSIARRQDHLTHTGRGLSLGVQSERGVYHVPIEVPVMRGGGDMNRTIDQSFTQFDIPCPKQTAVYSNNSTPAAQRVTNVMRHNFTLDISVIPPNEPTIADPLPTVSLKQAVDPPTDPPANPAPQGQETTHPALVTKPPDPLLRLPQRQDPLFARGGQSEGVDSGKPCLTNLSTITEESENYRSSQSSSRFTISSGSSRFSSSSASSHQTSASNITGPSDEVNPFEPHIINMMLNKVGVSNKMEMIDKPFQKLRSGCGFVLGEEEFENVRPISEGGFARVYSARRGDTLKAIKVQSPASEWEVTVIELLHSRLISNNLQQAVYSFIQVERAFRFKGTSVIIMEHHPYGSLLDLVNSHKSCASGVSVPVALYLTCEVVTAVAALHQCGLLHADIKPDNFMVKDLRAIQDVRGALGRGLCLVDFGRAIDLRVFPSDIMFTGSCKTDQFQCPHMREGRSWKWQVDYFGVAATLYTILNCSYMDIVKDNETDHYKVSSALPRKYRGLWTQILELLINTSEFIPLVALIQPLHNQLVSQPSRRFCGELGNSFKRLIEHRKLSAK